MTTRHAMGSADAAWLHMDRPENLMVINAVVWFDEPVDWGEFRKVIEDRLVAPFPRFRQRVCEPRLGVGVPQWEDDERFDLDLHLHSVALPAPGDRDALQSFIADRMVVALDRARPLWEFHLIDGYGSGSAVLCRMHHAIADGIALARVLFSLTDDDSDPGLAPATADHPSGLAGAAGAVLKSAGSALRITRAGAGAVLHEGLESIVHPRHVTDLAARAGEDVRTAAKVVLARPDADSVLRGRAGIAERVAWSDPIPLGAVRDMAHAHGATINDLLVTALTGALRAYLIERESLVDEIHAVVPFNLRPLDQPLPSDLGNRFGLVTLPLPVGEPTAAGRLATVMREMSKIKNSREGPIAYAVLSAIGWTPAQLEAALVDIFSSVGSAVVTNVPGPRDAVRLAGTTVRGVLVWAPVSGNMGMSVSIFSYAGDVTLGVMTDAGLVPDPERVVAAFTDELESLRSV